MNHLLPFQIFNCLDAQRYSRLTGITFSLRNSTQSYRQIAKLVEPILAFDHCRHTSCIPEWRIAFEIFA